MRTTPYPPFMRFILTAFVYRIGLNLPVALFSIYWVREAHASNTMIGIQNTAANLVIFIAPIGGTLLANVVGIHLALIASAVIGLIGTTLFYTFSIAREEPALVPSPSL